MVLLFALQTFFDVETITYSQFKALAKKGLLSNVVIGEETIHGEIKPEGVKEVLSADRLKFSRPLTASICVPRGWREIQASCLKSSFAAQSFSMFIFSSLPFPDLDSNFLRIRVIEPQIRIISFMS